MHPSVYKRPLLIILVGLIIGFWLEYRPVPGARDVSLFLPQQEVTLIGQVETFPITKKGKQNVWLRVQNVNGTSANGRVYARFSDFTPAWKDTLKITGRLQEPYGVRLPGNFDWRKYLANKRTFVEIKTSQTEIIKKSAWPWRWIRTIRQDILHTFNRSFPTQVAQIAGGVLLGERGEFPHDLYTAFQDSGAIHLLVASGGNVGFVTLLTIGIGMIFGFRRRLLFLVALGTAGIYTLIAGADTPLLRAYLMAVCACAGYFLRRNSGVFQGVLLSCLLILCVTPEALFDTGFQMSFLATLAIVICLNNYRIPTTWPRAVQFFGPIFLATLSSQLVLLPIFTNVFYKVSLTGLLSNMLLVPFASVLMGIGFAYYLCSCLHIGIILYYPCLWGFTLFQLMVEFFASFRLSSISVTAWNTGSIAAYYIVLFWLFQWPHKGFARRLCVPCLLGAVCCFVGGRWAQNKPQAYLLSEWNRRAAIIKTDWRTVAVFNDGMNEDKLRRVLYSLGITQAWLQLPFDNQGAGKEQPFETLWPGDIKSHLETKVRVTWELRQARDGHVWENTGYSGHEKEGLSYCVQTKGREICVGSHARFLQLPDGKTVSAIPNETVMRMW